jgi:hypothetical protein
MPSNSPLPHAGPRALPPARWPAQRCVDAEFEVLAESSAALMRVQVDGHPSIDQLVSTLHVFGVESQDLGRPALLLDLRELRTHYQRAELTRIGYEMAASFVHLSRIAVLVPAHRVTGVTERAAQRQGINMRVFDREDAATGWLGA